MIIFVSDAKLNYFIAMHFFLFFSFSETVCDHFTNCKSIFRSWNIDKSMNDVAYSIKIVDE